MVARFKTNKSKYFFSWCGEFTLCFWVAAVEMLQRIKNIQDTATENSKNHGGGRRQKMAQSGSELAALNPLWMVEYIWGHHSALALFLSSYSGVYWRSDE